jgi:hypothetical protein
MQAMMRMIDQQQLLHKSVAEATAAALRCFQPFPPRRTLPLAMVHSLRKAKRVLLQRLWLLVWRFSSSLYHATAAGGKGMQMLL